MESKQPAKKPVLTPQEAAMKGHADAMYDASYEQTRGGLSSGASPTQLTEMLQKSFAPPTQPISQEDIISQVASLAGTKIPQNGGFKNITGVFPALMNKLKGGEFNPLAQKPTELGMDAAIKLIDLQQNANEEQRRVEKNIREAPGQSAVSAKAVLDLAIQQAKEMGNYELLDQLTGTSGAGADVTKDPAMRKEFKEYEAKRIFENRTELDKFTKSTVPLVNNFMKLQDIAETLNDYKPGFLNQVVAKGDAVLGQFSADKRIVRYNAALNRMLGQLVKLGGDTGAFSDPEQLRQLEAAGKAEYPLSVKVELINDALDNLFINLDTRKELSGVPDFDKRFPILAKGRERLNKNRASSVESESGNSSSALTVENLFEGL